MGRRKWAKSNVYRNACEYNHSLCIHLFLQYGSNPPWLPSPVPMQIAPRIFEYRNGCTVRLNIKLYPIELSVVQGKRYEWNQSSTIQMNPSKMIYNSTGLFMAYFEWTVIVLILSLQELAGQCCFLDCAYRLVFPL